METATTLEQLLRQYATPGSLFERLPEGAVRCVACGHRCLIREGKRGVCMVRFNHGGTLYVPHGYVGSLQCDPIEKKPFFHVLPGARALSFGMLGCDYHCSYCVSESTLIVTNHGMMPIREIFESGERKEQRADGEISYPTAFSVVTQSGHQYPVVKAFRHPYDGPLVEIKPYYLPVLQCTPDHQVYATTGAAQEPTPVNAGALTPRHWLAIPRQFEFSSAHVVDAAALLGDEAPTFAIPRSLDAETVRTIMELSAQGLSSRELGQRWGKDSSYIRHVRSKVRRGLWRYEGIQSLICEGTTIRFAKEKRPGIPRRFELTPMAARLLGLYCAEGCVGRSRTRPNSLTVQFAFAKGEEILAQETKRLLGQLFGVKAGIVKRQTTLAVTVSKASLALLLQKLCGAHAVEKHVPMSLFEEHREVVEAFVQGLVDGDGCRYSTGKVSLTTVSWKLGYGLAWLLLKLGCCPSLYVQPLSKTKVIMGRVVHQQPTQYTIVWYTKPIQRKVIETGRFYLIPIRAISKKPFYGAVYNLEVEGEHSYLANFFAVKNCQNWVTSQALRDPVAGVPPQVVRPEELVAMARQLGARVITSTYNEPLITSEWAVELFKVAKANGLVTSYVSNGNATSEVLEYLRPWVDLYKVDLKGFSEAHYRSVMGGQLKAVLETIRLLHEMEFWVEIVTLIVPGWNDSDGELTQIAEFLASVSPHIPWHVTAFHKDYKMTDPDNTQSETLIRACELGTRAGLRYVYAGNLPGRVGRWEHTFCPQCKALLVERRGFTILKNRVVDSRCPECQMRIPGFWSFVNARTSVHGDGQEDRDG